MPFGISTRKKKTLLTYLSSFPQKSQTKRIQIVIDLIIKMNFKEIGWAVWTGFNWLRIGTGGGLM
jgi:hypothetical protein